MSRNYLVHKTTVCCKAILMSKIKDKKLGAVRIVQCGPVIGILRLINNMRCIATENHLLQK